MSFILLIIFVLLIGGSIWAWPLIAGALGLSNVTDKTSALKSIRQLMITYDLSVDEIEGVFNNTSNINSETERSKGDIAKTLFIYLGAIFILAGVSTYIGMFWSSMGSVMRVLVTLGVGYFLLIIQVSALQEGKFPKLILPLSFSSVFMMTGGWFVLIHEVFPQGDNWRAAVLFVFGVMALQQSILFAKYRSTILAFTALFFVYGFMQVGFDILGISMAFIAIILGISLFLVSTALEKSAQHVLSEPALFIGIIWLNSGLFDQIALYTSANWASLIIGICVMLTAYGMQKTERYPRLIGLGYFTGSAMMYAGLFDLVQHTSIELLYLAVTASILYGCVVLKSRALLMTTVIAMLSFIGYFSAEHFANSLGWPVTLVILGIIFLGVGTIAIKVKQSIKTNPNK